MKEYVVEKFGTKLFISPYLIEVDRKILVMYNLKDNTWITQ